MSYFNSLQAEYRAKRIMQLMAYAGEHKIAAQRNGNCIVNLNGHMFVFTLDERHELKELNHVDLVPAKTETEFFIGEPNT